MVSKEDLKKDNMYYEGVKRLRLMEASSIDQWMLLCGREITKCVVDHRNLTVKREEPTDEEMKMIRSFEEKNNYIVYYLIQDEGMWPDGATFPRYSLLYVDENEEEYESVGEDCICFCKTVPAYVVNMEEPKCSELTEIAFDTVDGLIMNIS